MIDRLSNFNSISYTEDRHELRVTGTKMSGTGEIFISGAGGDTVCNVHHQTTNVNDETFALVILFR